MRSVMYGVMPSAVWSELALPGWNPPERKQLLWDAEDVAPTL